MMKKFRNYFKVGLIFGLLLVLWPNLIHEPLHFIALQLQGGTGYVVLDFIPPIAPTTTTAVANVTQFFLLFPSMISVALLISLLLYKRKGDFTGIILPTYLTFDLVLNITNYAHEFNDFRYLVSSTQEATLLCFATILLGLSIILSYFLQYGRMENEEKKESILWSNA